MPFLPLTRARVTDSVLAQGGEYRIEEFRPELLDGMASVFGLLLGRNSDRSRECLQWKHLEAPTGGGPILLAVTHGASHDVVGMTGYIPTKFAIGSTGRVVRLACWVDLVVRPDHQKRGLGALLETESTTVLKRKGFPAAIGLSQNPATTALSSGRGWLPIGHATHARLGQPRTADGTSSGGGRLQRLARRGIRAVRRRIASVAPSSFSLFDRRAPRDAPAGFPVEASRDPRPAAMVRLAAACEDGRRLQRVRDEEYFQWRFRNPISNYRFLYKWDDDRLRGFLVMQEFVNQTDGRVAFVDITTESSQVAVDLLRSALALGGFGHVTMLAHSLADDVHEYLGRHGFRFEGPRRGVPSLILKPLETVEPGQSDCVPLFDLINPMVLDSWHLQLIDSDAF